jgi:hypothetical protein
MKPPELPKRKFQFTNSGIISAAIVAFLLLICLQPLYRKPTLQQQYVQSIEKAVPAAEGHLTSRIVGKITIIQFPHGEGMPHFAKTGVIFHLEDGRLGLAAFDENDVFLRYGWVTKMQ